MRAKNKKEADVLAGDLKALNDSRKDLTAKAVKEAIEYIEHSTLKEDKVLVVYLPECHESLAGIVAGSGKNTTGQSLLSRTLKKEQKAPADRLKLIICMRNFMSVKNFWINMVDIRWRRDCLFR